MDLLILNNPNCSCHSFSNSNSFLVLFCSQLYLLFSYISNCIVSSFKDYGTNEGLITGTAVCLVQPCLLAFSFIPCSMRLPTKPSGAGTDMRSPGGTATRTSVQVVKSPRHQTDKNHGSRQGKNQHGDPPSNLQSSRK